MKMKHNIIQIGKLLKGIRPILLGILGVFLTLNVSAQEPEMADALRSDGKIYVVVLIMSVVMLGLLVFVFLTDRKVQKLERMIKDK